MRRTLQARSALKAVAWLEYMPGTCVWQIERDNYPHKDFTSGQRTLRLVIISTFYTKD
jgi:hypothetical protein